MVPRTRLLQHLLLFLPEEPLVVVGPHATQRALLDLREDVAEVVDERERDELGGGGRGPRLRVGLKL